MGAVQLADDGADALAHLAGLLSRGGAAGADGPDGLIGDDHLAGLLGGHAGQCALDLISDVLHGHAQLPLLQALAHAHDGQQPGVQGGVYLLVHGEVGLVVILAALRVADDHILGPGITDHLGGDLAGKGAVVLVMAGLSADGNVAVLEQPHRAGDVGGGHTQHHSAPLALGHDRLDLFREFLRLGDGIVHFPVAGDDGLAVSSVHGNYILSIMKIALGDGPACQTLRWSAP